MILVLFLSVLFILLITLFVLVFGNIRLEAENVKIFNTPTYQYDFTIIIGLYLFNKYKILQYVIDKNKVNEKEVYIKLKDKVLEKGFISKFNKMHLHEFVKQINFNVEEINLNIRLGTENVIITSLLLSLISSAIGILLARGINRFDNKKHIYNILPVYENKNYFEASLNCIINVKLVHIIYVIFKFKKRSGNNNERTSNRRSYDYSYE